MTTFALRWAAVAILGLAGAARLAQEKVLALEEIKTEAQLGAAVSELDRQLFEAYNHCDLKKFDSLLADDVEFYHDQGGVTLGHAALTESVRNNICTGDTQRVRDGDSQNLPHEGTWRDRDGRAPVHASEDGSRQWDRRSELRSSLAVSGRSMEAEPGT